MATAACVPIPLQTEDPVDQEHLEAITLSSREDVYKQFGSPREAYEIDGRSYVVFEVKDIDEYFGLTHPAIYVMPMIAMQGPINPFYESVTIKCLLVVIEQDSVLRAEARPADEESDCAGVFKDRIVVAAEGALAEGVSPAVEAGNIIGQWRAYKSLGDTPEGHIWLCRTADQGLREAQVRLADIYYNGWFGFDKDHNRSYMWFNLAAEGKGKWAEWASTQIQSRFVDTEAFDLDRSNRMLAGWRQGECENELFRAALIPDWARMIDRYAAYPYTIEVDETSRTTKAADTIEDILSQVPAELDAGLRSAAEGGDTESQWLAYRALGHTAEGYKWLCRAADQGQTQSRIELGYLYRSGAYGFTQDYSQSYVWYRLAGAGEQREAVEKWRKKLEKGSACRKGKGQACFIATEIVQLQNVLQSEGVSKAEELLHQWQPGQCACELATASSGN